ncbi:MAG: ribonuclease HI [Thermoguttaceae bacterium]
MPPKTTSHIPAEVILYTDGACSGNPGPGGWGFILRHIASGKERVDSGGERATTNNRMEMLAVIRGLESLTRNTNVEIVSDSKYVLDGIRDWLPKWKAKGWKRTGGAIKNEELWRHLDELVSRHSVVCTYVRGHTGHTENEECDRLAREAIKKLR